MAEETCASAKLDWTSIDRAPHSEWLDWYRRGLAIRRAEIVPLLATIQAGGRDEGLGDGAGFVRWPLRAGDALVLAANLSATPARGFPAEPGRVLWEEGEVGHDGTFGPWTVQWSVEGLLRHEPASPALDDLAKRMGIEPQFRNAKGEIVETSSETKRSLLAAMGVKAADEAQARGALEDLDRAEWLRPLPIVQVLRAEASPPAIELVLPAGTGEIAWCLALEDGSERTGRVAFDDLELMDARSVDGTPLERRRLLLESGLPWGYHRLAIEPGSAS